MFISWGTKGTSTNLGYAADFCPMCRGIKGFQIMRIGKASHVYGMSVGSGDLVGHNRECTKCGVVLGANPANYKEIVERTEKMNLDTLITATFPTVREHHAERLKLEAFITQHPDKLEPATRSKLLAEPFQLMEHVVQQRFAKRHIDMTMVAIVIITLFFFQVAGNMAKTAAPGQSPMGSVFLVVFIAACIALIWQGRRAKRKYMRVTIYPVLANSLRALKPNTDELNAVQAMLTKSKTAMAKHLQLKVLVPMINR